MIGVGFNGIASRDLALDLLQVQADRFDPSHNVVHVLNFEYLGASFL